MHIHLTGKEMLSIVHVNWLGPCLSCSRASYSITHATVATQEREISKSGSLCWMVANEMFLLIFGAERWYNEDLEIPIQTL